MAASVIPSSESASLPDSGAHSAGMELQVASNQQTQLALPSDISVADSDGTTTQPSQSDINLGELKQTHNSSETDLEKAGLEGGLEGEGEAKKADNEPGPPPDGGYGWVIVLAAFLIHMFVFAPQYAFGVYVRYYSDSNRYPGASLTTLAFVGSVAAAGCPAFGPISGRAADLYNPRYIVFGGGCVLAVAFILASFATQIWALFLTQGFLYGVGQSFSYFPVIGILPTWFDKRRGLAIGIAVAGTGIGGLAFSPLTQTMIDTVGVEWALRITGIIQFVVVTFVAIILRSRYKPMRRKSVVAAQKLANTAKPKLFDFSFFKNSQFTRMWICQFIGFFGFFSPFFFGSTYALTQGLSQAQGSLIVGLTNLGSSIGRLIVGGFSDRFGTFNAFVICIFLGGLSMMVIWPFSHNFGMLVFFGLFYSFFSGGFISLQATCLAQIVGIRSISSAIGLLYFAGATANLVGPPLGAVIINNAGYVAMMMFGGACMLVAGSFMLWIRMERAGGWTKFAKIV